MTKKILMFLLLSVSTAFSQDQFNAMSSSAGGFSRVGFGARGKALGNSISAVSKGDVDIYYNPALSVFQNGNSLHTAYTFLSLDRTLNFISFTKKFELGKTFDSTITKRVRPTAGLSFGIINSGVSNIEERDNQGFQTGNLSVSENQFFLNLALKLSKKVSAGFNAKFYYSKLYKEMTSTTLGFDFGVLYSVNDNLNVALVIKDLNSKYKWDSAKIYGLDGITKEEKFPQLNKLGMSYFFREYNLLVSTEFESSSLGTKVLKFGGEYYILNALAIRAGMDYININNFDIPLRPAFGFEYSYLLGTFLFGLNYAYNFEPYSEFDQHIIGVNINF
ncbi:MAG: hypothetical protein CO129_04040 [Ignavibacteriales bacterium CG_4_9_14_3_um_filter_34_10]|nr:MAG: hypothetical protein CO129_04040 [Ignavibacteriales bacterium CG_4_9_14_3_um_filter_34_10]